MIRGFEYSAYSVGMLKGVQDEIIGRTGNCNLRWAAPHRSLESMRGVWVRPSSQDGSGQPRYGVGATVKLGFGVSWAAVIDTSAVLYNFGRPCKLGPKSA